MKYTKESIITNLARFRSRTLYSWNELSEEFIEKYLDNVDWIFISLYQNLSDEFIKKHFSKLSVEYLLENRRLRKSKFLQKIRMLK